MPNSMYCVVYREGLRATFVVVGTDEGDALRLAQSGVSFGGLCQFFADTMDDAVAAETAGGLLGKWLQSGWIAAIA